MNWNKLQSNEELEELISNSHHRPQVIFKHSTRCSISTTALSRLERNPPPTSADFYFLDLLAHRSLSNDVADRFSVAHESPQVLIIRQGACIFDDSHLGISMADIADQVA